MLYYWLGNAEQVFQLQNSTSSCLKKKHIYSLEAIYSLIAQMWTELFHTEPNFEQIQASLFAHVNPALKIV